MGGWCLVSVLYKPILSLDGVVRTLGNWCDRLVFLSSLLLIKTVLKSQFFIRTVKMLCVGLKPILALNII